jgi:predicted RNase H-like HicB family nuclease
MLNTYTAKYTRISAGYMGQLIEWPEVITEGKSLDDCRELLHDALQEMIAAYSQQQKEMPIEALGVRAAPVRERSSEALPDGRGSENSWLNCDEIRGNKHEPS